MEKERLVAFSDGVIAILLTLMVFNMKPPDSAAWSSITNLVPEFLIYLLSFVYIAIYWNNHHHMFQTVTRVNGKILWANTHLLFWLSLIPLTTTWMWQHHQSPAPVALYGVVLLMASLAYYLLQKCIVKNQGDGSLLAQAIGRDVKGKISPLLYVTAVLTALVSPHMSLVFYTFVALMWLIPDRRIERTIH